MLAIVEDEQRLLVPEIGRRTVDGRAPVRDRDADAAAHDIGDDLRVEDRSQLDHPDAVRRVAEHRTPDLDGEPGLSGASGAGQRHEPMQRQARPDLRLLHVSADVGRQLRR